MFDRVFVSMHARWLPIGLLALVPTAAFGEIPCTLSCGAESKCGTSLADKPGAGGRMFKVLNCERTDRIALTKMVVWYPRKAILTGKLVPEMASIGELTADGDQDCKGLTCLFKVARSKIPGASPMGITTDADSASSTGARAGLPFDEILVPTRGLVLRSRDNGKISGNFILVDIQSKVERAQVPVIDGKAVVPATFLQSGASYGYRWQNSGISLEGSFSVARDATAERVERAVLRRVQDLGLSGSDELLARVAALTAAGLRWDAQMLYERIAEE